MGKQQKSNSKVKKNSVYLKEEGGGYIGIKKPQKRHPKFGLFQKFKSGTKYIYPPQLEVINLQFSTGCISEETALKQINSLKEQLYKERDRHQAKRVYHNENTKLVHTYWEIEYEDRDLIDEDTMKSDLMRSVGALGQLSINVASKQEMQKAVNTFYQDKPNLQRRAVTRLNQLLKFAGRNFELKKAREERKEVAYLTLNDFEKVAQIIKEEDFKILCWIAITTGLRLGEIFAIERPLFRDTYLMVTSQIDSNLSRRDTKNRLKRKAFILPGGQIWVNKWLSLDKNTKDTLRNKNHARILKKYCDKVFKNQTKQIKFHDLRHSYAIHLLGKGATLAHIAQSLGNTQSVCEKYYTGFVLSDDSLETLVKTFETASND